MFWGVRVESEDLGGSNESRIFLDALVTYSDSCTLPKLTPTCPYYRKTALVPTCQEECRTIIHNRNAASRPVVAVEVDGLVLTGRAIPKAVVSGLSSFDAVEQYLVFKDEDPGAQTTASLLLSLRAAVSREIGGSTTGSSLSAMAIWGELVRRGVEMERVAIGGFVDEMALMVVSHVTLATLIRAEMLEPSLLQTNLDKAEFRSEWVELLQAAYREWLHLPERRRSTRHDATRAVFTMLARVYPGLAESGELESFLAEFPEISFAYSGRFTGRVAEWFSHLIDDDLGAALRGRAPSPEIFSALTPRSNRDEVGLWIWERFTVTHIEDWQLSSMMLEWKWAKDAQTDACTARAMAERLIPQDSIGDLALELASATHVRRRRRTGLDASIFIDRASERLTRGDWQGASRIFGGLVELRPGDGDAWNNLGFCLIWGDTEGALASLRRAELFYRLPTTVCRANQALALHLLGRDSEATRLLEKTLAEPLRDTRQIRAVMWSHSGVEDDQRTLTDWIDPLEYLKELSAHISEPNCKYLVANRADK